MNPKSKFGYAPVRRYANEFYFTPPGYRTIHASTMDFRPVLEPTGWLLEVRTGAGWTLAEAGIAHSPESAKLHVHTAKNRHIRKTFFSGQYMRELSKMQRTHVEEYVSAAQWRVNYFKVESKVKPNLDERKNSVGEHAELVAARDKYRLERMGLES